MTAQIIQLKAQSAYIQAMGTRFGEARNDSGEQAKIAQSIALANLEARAAHLSRAAKQAQRDRDEAFALAAGVPVIWAVTKLRGWS